MTAMTGDDGDLFSVRRTHQVLLQLSIRHFISRDAEHLLRERHSVAAGNHAAASLLPSGSEFARFAQRPQAGRKVLYSLGGEIGVGVIGKERPVDLSLLEVGKDFSGLLEFSTIAGAGRPQQESGDLAGNRS